MYMVLCDDIPIYDLRDEELTLIEPRLTLEVNSPGSFECRIPPTHPRYDLPVKMLSRITVLQDNVELFKGRITQTKIDYYNRKQIYCEGELAFLNDSIQRPAEYHDMTVRGYFEKLISIHNEQVETDKRFEVGQVTVTDPNDSLYRYTNWENTLTAIKEDLISSLGGYIRVRNENGHRYIDLIAEYPNINTQVIEFGENLLDFTRNIDLTDIATVVVPLGARLEESEIQALEERLTIESVNSGKDYLVNQDAVNKYGWIVKVVTWDDVTTPERLKAKGQSWLNDEQFEAMTIEAKAVDLHYIDDSQETFKLGDSVRIVSAVHGLDRYFPVTKLTISLNDLKNNTVTFNGLVKVSVSSRSNAVSQSLRTTIEQIPTKNAVVQEAINQATALITAATHGYVTITDDASELLIADNADYKKATKLWRWNLNGLGYSNTGYNGTYATAITMDGQIVGERLVAGSVSAEKLSSTYRETVEREIASAEESARSDAEAYTDGELKKYYTKSEVETSIQNARDAVLLSAKETAEQYVDGKLKSYSTSAQIKVTTDAITSEVKKKLNTSDFSTKVQQSASSVQIAWNNISKYVEFSDGALKIFDTADEASHKMVAQYNSNGSHFYRDGVYLGKIGTNGFQNEPTYRGLVFDLEYTTGYMAWARKTSSTADIYTTLFAYYSDDTIAQKGFHFGDYVYFGGNFRINDEGGFYSYTDNSIKLWAEGGVSLGDKSTSCCQFTGSEFKIWNNKSIDFYSTLNLHGWGYTNDSDARMKKNIEETAVNGLDIINGIDLKSFDWVTSGEHETIGIIAQQIQEKAPELVEQCADGHLQLKADKLVYYCIKAVQELCEHLHMGYDVPVWSDPFTLLDKKTFCAKLESGKETKKTPLPDEPIVLPNNNVMRG